LFRHGKSIYFLKENQFASHTKIIDLEWFSSNKRIEGKSFCTAYLNLNKTNIKTQTTSQILVVLQQQFNWLYYLQLIIYWAMMSIMYNTEALAQVSPSETTHFSWDPITCRITKHLITNIWEKYIKVWISYNRLFQMNYFFIPNRGDFARGILQPYTQLLKKV
jgi:N-acetyl-gamma-glutamyl-phosphate reductase